MCLCARVELAHVCYVIRVIVVPNMFLFSLKFMAFYLKSSLSELYLPAIHPNSCSLFSLPLFLSLCHPLMSDVSVSRGLSKSKCVCL